MTDFNPADLALARSHAYDLLGRILLEGLSPEIMLLVSQVPQLAEHISSVPNYDELAAEHYHLFGFDIFPFASIFLDDSGLLGGEKTAWAAERLATAGYVASEQPADHAGHFLRALGSLCGAEADAWHDNLPLVAAQMEQRQASILNDISRWVWGLLACIEVQSAPFYTTVAELTADLIANQLSPALEVVEQPPDPAVELNLDDPQTGLRDIARFLLMPVQSGWFLTRDDMTNIGRALDLPRGFGGREQMLVNLLRTAGQYESLPALVDALLAHLRRWMTIYDRYQQMSTTPLTGLLFWQSRLKRLEVMLNRMRTATLSD